MDKIKKFVSSEVVNKPLKLVYCSGELEKNDRIIYNYFLTLIDNFFYKEKNKYEEDRGYYFYTTVKDINKLTNIHYLDIKSSVKRLFEKHLVIDMLDTQEYIQLVGEIKISKDNDIKIFFSPRICEIVLSNQYTRLDFALSNKFKSKYSLIMYEIIKSMENEKQGIILLKNKIKDLEIFKKLMGIDKVKTYSLNAHLRNKVLEPMKKEINEITNYKFDYKIVGRGPKADLELDIRLKNKGLQIPNTIDKSNLHKVMDKVLGDEVEYSKYKNRLTRKETQHNSNIEELNQRIEDSKESIEKLRKHPLTKKFKELQEVNKKNKDMVHYDEFDPFITYHFSLKESKSNIFKLKKNISRIKVEIKNLTKQLLETKNNEELKRIDEKITKLTKENFDNEKDLKYHKQGLEWLNSKIKNMEEKRKEELQEYKEENDPYNRDSGLEHIFDVDPLEVMEKIKKDLGEDKNDNDEIPF